LRQVVLDASAILAYLLKERGWEVVDLYLRERPSASAVNVAEVVKKLVREGAEASEALRTVELLGIVVEPFNLESSRAAGLFCDSQFGLALGDIACLATGANLGAVVVTADFHWTRLESPVEVVAIRDRMGA
jgi:PIN domain nuclease of toxin-antitoxin system